MTFTSSIICMYRYLNTCGKLMPTIVPYKSKYKIYLELIQSVEQRTLGSLRTVGKLSVTEYFKKIIRNLRIQGDGDPVKNIPVGIKFVRLND